MWTPVLSCEEESLVCVNDEFFKAADFSIYIPFSTLSASHFLVNSLAVFNPIPLCFLLSLRPFNVASVSLASSGLQRSPQSPGGVPALGGDGSDPRGVCRRPGGPHPSAGRRHHHHKERVNVCWKSVERRTCLIMHHLSRSFSLYVLFWSSSVIFFFLNTWWTFMKGHDCLGKTSDQQPELHCFHSVTVHQRNQTTLICRAYLSVKYLIRGGCNSISHLITHPKQRPDP